MLSSFFIFLPCTFCLVAFLVSLSKWETDRRDRFFMIVSICAAIYFFMDAFYVHAVVDSYRLIVIFNVVGTTASLYLLPTFYVWLRSYQEGKPVKSGVYWVGYSVGLVHFIIMCMLYGMMGWSGAIDYVYHMAHGLAFDVETSLQSQRLMFYVCYLTYNIVLLMEIIFIMAYLLLMVVRLLREKNKTSEDKFLIRLYVCAILLFVVVSMRMGIGAEHLIKTPWLSCLMSALLATILYMMYANKFFHELVQAKEDSEMKRHIVDRAPSTLQASFEKYMIAEQAYLRPNLTLEDVASTIGSNRTYLSQMLQSTYGMSFPDYINHRRIEFAQHYLTEHPDAIQEDVAIRSGYSGASAFNKKFKEVTGMTPREWMIKRSAQH